MAYLDTAHVQSPVQTSRQPIKVWLFRPNADVAGRPAVQRAVKAHVQEVQQMLLAATLAAASIVAVAAALLIHS